MKTQLFCTENEMDEAFKDSTERKLLSFAITGNGVLAFYEESSRFQVKPEAKKDSVICAMVNRSHMYLSKRNKPTFLLTEAMVLTKEEASKKASFMSRKGKYFWKARKL